MTPRIPPEILVETFVRIVIMLIESGQENN